MQLLFEDECRKLSLLPWNNEQTILTCFTIDKLKIPPAVEEVGSAALACAVAYPGKGVGM